MAKAHSRATLEVGCRASKMLEMSSFEDELYK